VLLRAAVGIPVVYAGLLTASSPVPSVLILIAAAAAILVLAGLWTPLAAGVITLIELGLAWSHPGDSWTLIQIGILSAALAMLGPGGCSVDARLFGRKYIQIP
jgi:uncharacterized membrane protein YphA (DoxX/SURF4 family)